MWPWRVAQIKKNELHLMNKYFRITESLFIYNTAQLEITIRPTMYELLSIFQTKDINLKYWLPDIWLSLISHTSNTRRLLHCQLNSSGTIRWWNRKKIKFRCSNIIEGTSTPQVRANLRKMPKQKTLKKKKRRVCVLSHFICSNVVYGTSYTPSSGFRPC